MAWLCSLCTVSTSRGYGGHKDGVGTEKIVIGGLCFLLSVQIVESDDNIKEIQ